MHEQRKETKIKNENLKIKNMSYGTGYSGEK